MKKKKRKGPTLKATNTVDLVRVEDCAPLPRTRAGLARFESLKLFCPAQSYDVQINPAIFLNDATTFEDENFFVNKFISKESGDEIQLIHLFA